MSFDGVPSGTGKTSGIGNIVQSFFFLPRQPSAGGLVWGSGPVEQLPTSTDDTPEPKQFKAGDTAVALIQKSGWAFGMLGSHIWSVGQEDTYGESSSTLLQPFVSRSFGRGTSVSPGSALYNAGRYQRLMAQAFLDAAPFEEDGSLIEDPYRAAARTRAMATEAEVLLLQSLLLSPSDARAWADLAWARILREDVAGAQTALERSWEFAPRDLDLAIRRLDAIDLLHTAYPMAVAAGFGLDGATGDMQTLARHRPRTFEKYLKLSPLLADLAASRGLTPPT